MIPELINKLYENKLISKKDLKSLTPLKKDYDKKFGNFLIDNKYLSKNDLKSFVIKNQDILFDIFNEWLNKHPDIANAIIWRETSAKNEPNGFHSNYNLWSKNKKMELSTTFWKILMDISSNLKEAPNCTIKLSEDGTVYSTDLKHDDAWNYYITYVAHSLRVEIDKLVHWSILKYNSTQLEYLLDSRTFFEYFEDKDIYSIIRWDNSFFSHGAVTIGDPLKIYDFIDNEKFIGITRWGTIGRFLGWCRDELSHFEGGNTPENYQKHWQYEGYPPIERIISGTNHQDTGFGHYTAGCFGTTGFMRGVLRTINIPVLLEERCGHAMPHFVYDTTHEFFLSHGDDPYNSLYKHNTPKFIPLELIIDHNKFDEWFNKDLPHKTICNNIGRHALELAVEYIPNGILKMYCEDVSNGKTIEESRIYNEIFRDHIPLSELKLFGFWDRLKIKTESMGGCEYIQNNKNNNINKKRRFK
jgi:hypothetical protein